MNAVKKFFEYTLPAVTVVFLALFFRILPGGHEFLSLGVSFAVGAFLLGGGIVLFFLEQKIIVGSFSLGRVGAVLFVLIGIFILFNTYLSSVLFHSGGL